MTLRVSGGQRAALSVLFAATAALAAAPGCGSSDNGGSKINTHSTGSTPGQGDASTGPGGEGGRTGIFGSDSGFLADAQPQVIDPDAACGESSIDATPRQVSILLVIDESGSMTQKPTGFSTDKWTALKAALGTTLSKVQNDISFGLELFPYPVDPTKPIPAKCIDNCCEMPAAPGINIPIDTGSKAVPKIVAALDATAPAGGTPTALALTRALDYFTSGGGAALTGDRYVLLATDGGPNCSTALTTCDITQCTMNLDSECPLPSGSSCCDSQIAGPTAPTRCLDDTATKAAIDALHSAGVKTFVVGIPGAEIYGSALDTFAVAGGEENPVSPPKYFSVSAAGGTAALAGVLSSITKNLVTVCQLPLQTEPQDPLKINVLVDGVRIPRGSDGWDLDQTTSPSTIVLLGSTCDKVQAEGAQRVQVLEGCKTRTR